MPDVHANVALINKEIIACLKLLWRSKCSVSQSFMCRKRATTVVKSESVTALGRHECEALAVLQPQAQVTTAEASVVPEKRESCFSSLHLRPRC